MLIYARRDALQCFFVGVRCKVSKQQLMRTLALHDFQAVEQPAATIDRDLQRCEAMRGDEKERCLRALRDAARRDDRPPHAGPGPERGPESTGMSSGAGSTGPGVGGGTTGGAGVR